MSQASLRTDRSHRARGALTGIGSLLAGLVTGLCATALHNTWWGFGLAVIGTFALILAVPGGRLGGPLAALGWLTAVVLALVGRPEGDFAIAANLRGQLLLGLGLVVLAAGVFTAVRRPPTRPHGGAAGELGAETGSEGGVARPERVLDTRDEGDGSLH